MTEYPQVMRNVKVGRGGSWTGPKGLESGSQAEKELGDDGRVLVRASGTEPVVRVMVEALAKTAQWATLIVSRSSGQSVDRGLGRGKEGRDPDRVAR